MTEPEITEEQLQTLHPLAAGLIAVFEEAGAKPTFAFDETHLGIVAEGLTALYENQELRDATRSLLGVAHGFEQQGMNRPAQQMFELLRQKPLLDALDRINAARDAENRDAVAASSDKFTSFQDSTTQRSAPKVGEERPDGTLSIDKLGFPKRL